MELNNSLRRARQKFMGFRRVERYSCKHNVLFSDPTVRDEDVILYPGRPALLIF